MGLPVHGRARVFDAIAANTTTVLSSLAGFGFIDRAGYVLLEVVGASTPSFTLDIQGKVDEGGTYTNVTYEQVWQTGGAVTPSVAQLSITDTTRRFYVIPNPPPYLQLKAVRTTGTLTVDASYISVPRSQALLTTARGSILAEGPAASDAVKAGNPVLLGISVDEVTPVAADEGDVRDARGDTFGDQRVVVTDSADGASIYAENLLTGQSTNIARRALYVQAIAGQVSEATPNQKWPISVGVSGIEWRQKLAVGLYQNNGDATSAVSADAVMGVVRTAYLASAARTATTNGADRTNYNFHGLTIFVNISASTTGAITMAVQLKDQTSGNYVSVYTAALSISSTGQRAYNVRLAAENTEGWTETFLGGIDARTYRVIFTHADAVSITYSVDLVEMP